MIAKVKKRNSGASTNHSTRLSRTSQRVITAIEGMQITRFKTSMMGHSAYTCTYSHGRTIPTTLTTLTLSLFVAKHDHRDRENKGPDGMAAFPGQGVPEEIIASY